MDNIKAFATYRLPHASDFYTIYSTDYPLIVNELNFLDKDKFYISSFDKKTIACVKSEKMMKNQFVSCYMELNKAPKTTPKNAFIKQVELAIKKIKNEDLEKVVLSTIKTKSKPENFNWQTLFKKLTQQYPNAFVYAFYSDLTGFWIGATPELFLDKEHTDYHTVALAGTRKLKDNWTKKEKDEQHLVTRFITNKLKEKTKKIEVSPVHDVTIGNIKHLETNINFNLYLNEDINPIISAINPTPAVCGIPQTKAYTFIKQIEEHNRSFYTGLIGPIGIKSTTGLFVNLRCMQICKNTLVLYAGCGITKNSIPKDEWYETEEKAEILSHFL